MLGSRKNHFAAGGSEWRAGWSGPAVVFPQPLSPTSPSVSPSMNGEIYIINSSNVSNHLFEEAAPDGEELF
jgi:hypothetical protein